MLPLINGEIIVVDGIGATMVPDVSIPFTLEMLFSEKNSVLDAICPPLN